jgi:hypothetical protein
MSNRDPYSDTGLATGELFTPDSGNLSARRTSHCLYTFGG